MTWKVPATVVRVIDGDTFIADLDLGWFTWRRDQRVRVLGINAPEIRGETKDAGLAARAYAGSLLALGSQVTIESFNLDDFGRTVGKVTLTNGDDFGALMIETGHAVVDDATGGSKFD